MPQDNPTSEEGNIALARRCDAWDDGVTAILTDGAATAQLHRRLQSMMAAGLELTGFDLWAYPALYGRH